MNRRGFEFSFGWMFALMVGAAALFIAIYATTTLLDTGEQYVDTSTSLSVSTLLSPLETISESSRLNFMYSPTTLKLSFSCKTSGKFGVQGISALTSGIRERGADNFATTELEFENKYIFSPSSVQGEQFNVISTDFRYPFKIASLTTIFEDSRAYCFVQAPSSVIRVLNNSQTSNLRFVSSLSACSAGSTTVCFATSGCSIDVSTNSKTVTKNGAVLYYGGEDDSFNTNDALLYPAIFSDSTLYECQLKRLAMRISTLAELYQEKELLVSMNGCSSNLNVPLSALISTASAFAGSQDIRSLAQQSQEVDAKNEYQNCQLY